MTSICSSSSNGFEHEGYKGGVSDDQERLPADRETPVPPRDEIERVRRNMTGYGHADG
jgi:hypothetical protein